MQGIQSDIWRSTEICNINQPANKLSVVSVKVIMLMMN